MSGDIVGGDTSDWRAGDSDATASSLDASTVDGVSIDVGDVTGADHGGGDTHGAADASDTTITDTSGPGLDAWPDDLLSNFQAEVVPADGDSSGDDAADSADAQDSGPIEDALSAADSADEADVGPAPRACRGTDASIWRDLSGYGHDGSFFDWDTSIFWAGDGTPAAPYSLEMGGTPAPRVELPNADALRLGTGSVEFWLRPQSTTFSNKMVYNHRAGAQFAGVVLVSQDGQWKGLGSASGTTWDAVFAASVHTIGRWQHVVLSWEQTAGSTAMRIYVDGAQTGAKTIAGNIVYSGKGRPQIGGLDGGYGSFHGGIAIARIYNGALTAAEVRGLYNADAEARFGRAAAAGESSWPMAELVASFDATPCD